MIALYMTNRANSKVQNVEDKAMEFKIWWTEQSMRYLQEAQLRVSSRETKIVNHRGLFSSMGGNE